MLGRGESIGGASPPSADHPPQYLEHDTRDDLCPFRVWVTRIAEVFFPQAAADYGQGDIRSFAELFQPILTGTRAKRRACYKSGFVGLFRGDTIAPERPGLSRAEIAPASQAVSRTNNVEALAFGPEHVR